MCTVALLRSEERVDELDLEMKKIYDYEMMAYGSLLLSMHDASVHRITPSHLF